jgi:uncharacterized protein YjbJ (UPF0337 family)
MATDPFEGKWRQMRGELRSWWGRLTDDDLEKIGGKKDRLIGVLREKYGYTREAAQQEIDRRFREYDERTRASTPERTGQAAAATAPNVGAGVQELTDKAKSGGEEAASAAATKAAQSVSAVGEKIGSLADTIREKAPHEGAVGTAAGTVADKLGAAGSYLQEKKLDQVTGDLSGLIRRHPIPALMIGLGIGYLLARSMRR